MRVRKVAEVRKLHAGDIDAVLAIERRSYPDPWPRSAFTDDLDGKAPPLVAECEGRIAGYICCMLGPQELHITNIAVDEPFRRRGIAAQLLAAAIASGAVHGCAWVYLDVRPSNRAARMLYEQFGFVELFRRKRYYIRPPEDCLVMARQVDPSEADLSSWFSGLSEGKQERE